MAVAYNQYARVDPKNNSMWNICLVWCINFSEDPMNGFEVYYHLEIIGQTGDNCIIKYAQIERNNLKR